jgi:hypothetical protein
MHAKIFLPQLIVFYATGFSYSVRDGATDFIESDLTERYVGIGHVAEKL